MDYKIISFLLFFSWLIPIAWIQYRRWRRRQFQSQFQLWRLHAYGGGAPIEYKATSKQDAIEYCAKIHGTVMFVDESTRMIFYKPLGFTKNP